MGLIAARATPQGSGGIGIVRISGPGARDVLGRMFIASRADFKDFEPWRLYYGRVLDKADRPLDEALAVFMPGPRSFTGEDVAEIHCHGGPAIVDAVLESALARGVRLAERGEFTRRAFINGRIDLSQAEAVAEMIAAPTREGVDLGFKRLSGAMAETAARLAAQLDKAASLAAIGMDFPDEELPDFSGESFAEIIGGAALEMKKLASSVKRARLMERGARVVLAGAVNAGKSSLFNAMCGQDRALVTDAPGTTRDFLEAVLQVDGLPLRLVDTAGLRSAGEDPGQIEALGIARALEQLRQADAVILTLDGKAWTELPDLEKKKLLADSLVIAGDVPVLVALNKCDIAPDASLQGFCVLPQCRVSAATGENVEALLAKLRVLLLGAPRLSEPGPVPNERQGQALANAAVELEALLEEWEAGASLDCLATRLDSARGWLGELLGLGTPGEILDGIFANFCIGK